MEIVRKLLSANEISPPDIRYDADCDCFQTTFDGGATWVDTPGTDPRSAPQYQAPPPTGGDPRCDGAARMTALLKDSNDASIHAVNVVQAYSALFAVIALIFTLGVGLLVSLLIALADLIFSVGTTAVDDAFTTDVYDQIECITYCHLNAGGQFDDETAWNAYQDEIGATFGLSVVTTVLARMFLSFGFVTLNNAASLRTETGDCADCTNCGWCYEWSDAASIASGYFTQLFDAQGGQSVFYNVTFDVSTTITALDMKFTVNTGSGGAAAFWVPIADRITLATFSGDADGELFYNTMADPEPPISGATGMQFGANGNDGGNVTFLNYLKVSGTGTMPAFTGGEAC